MIRFDTALEVNAHLELAEAGLMPSIPHALACKRTPDEHCSWVLRPEGVGDVMRTATTLRERGSAYCLLLGFPTQPVNTDTADLNDWAALAEKRVNFPVRRLQDNKKFPCGDSPCCNCHKQTQKREAQAEFKGAFERYQGYLQTMKRQYPTLDDRQVTLLTLWATAESERYPGCKITEKELGKHFGRTDRTIRRWLDEVANDYPGIYNRFEWMRNERLQKTGAYEVRG